MNRIQILDQMTIDKIAAGEVVERPASVVKELVENAVDAGADRITVEIKGGGISLIRVTDNGGGIPGGDVPSAFLRHATSKIREAEDLASLTSLGFRGEALSSIAAVSRVELITKTQDDLAATRYVIEGGREVLREEVGAPSGTTIIVRDLFYNTPARAKFLKSPLTEASHAGDYVEQLILSNPGIAFTWIVNGQTKLSTSGNGSVPDAIYHIYGRDIARLTVPVDYSEEGIRITGLIGKPEVNRGNRNFENYYINGRYTKSRIIARAIEDAYSTKLMQHQFPFTCLVISADGDAVDVNVHPTKMEVRFSDEKRIYDAVRAAVSGTLKNLDMIIHSAADEKKERGEREAPSGRAEEKKVRPAEPFESAGAAREAAQKEAERRAAEAEAAGSASGAGTAGRTGEPGAYTNAAGSAGQRLKDSLVREHTSYAGESLVRNERTSAAAGDRGRFVQQTFQPAFEEKPAEPMRRIVGQVFSTYWIFEYGDEMYMIDQHAAHERVLFERFMRAYEERTILSEPLSPPMIVTLDAREEGLLLGAMEAFTALGFEIEPFGDRDYAIRQVPYTLGQLESGDLFREILDQLEFSRRIEDNRTYIKKVATEACKAAVKGGGRLSPEEAKQLLDDLMACEDPWHCPHGRPTVLTFSREDLEKRFKRIV